jgi:hypothetical protein
MLSVECYVNSFVDSTISISVWVCDVYGLVELHMELDP